MRFDILTIFPQLVSSPLEEGIIRRAIRDKRIEVAIHNIRDFATDRHNMTDDRPFGGDEGMVMKPEPLAAAIRHAREVAPDSTVVLMSPQGRCLSQAVAGDLATRPGLILVCGRYEGIDERIRAHYVDEELSIGDFVLTGGELAALVVIDAVVRLLPGVLGCADSADNDTFCKGLLKHPQYTRPRDFEGHTVPDELLSGDHAAIRAWRLVASVRQTLERRPELLRNMTFTAAEEKLLRRKGLWAAIARLIDSERSHQ